MRVIINSDVIISNFTLDEALSASFKKLCVTCVDHSHIIVIPRTALLEFYRQTRGHVEGRRNQLIHSYKVLDQYGLQHDSVDPEAIIPDIDLENHLSSSGVHFEVIDASYDQFIDAHRRACLREPPHSGGSGSDEMRDLLIWCICIDIAKADGGAILISRDTIHSGTTGRSEAEDAGLIRVSDFDAALERLQVETPAFSLARRLLTPLWPELRDANIPIGDEPTLDRVFDASFVRDDAGISIARFSARIVGRDGSIIDATVSIERQGGLAVTIDLDHLTIDGQTLPRRRLTGTSEVIPFDVIEDTPPEEDKDSLEDLRRVLGADDEA